MEYWEFRVEILVVVYFLWDVLSLGFVKVEVFENILGFLLKFYKRFTLGIKSIFLN